MGATSPAELLGGERGISGVQQDCVYHRGNGDGLSDRVIVADVEHLYYRNPGQRIAQLLVHSGFDLVDELQRVGAAESLLRDDWLGRRLTSQKEGATVGGTVAAISRMRRSEMGPGPLGIRETRPMADAPIRTARAASASDAMQQTLTRVVTGNISGPLVDTMYGNCIQFYRGGARLQRLRTSPVTREVTCS